MPKATPAYRVAQSRAKIVRPKTGEGSRKGRKVRVGLKTVNDSISQLKDLLEEFTGLARKMANYKADDLVLVDGDDARIRGLNAIGDWYSSALKAVRQHKPPPETQ